jgi:hypothetical protein
MLGQMLKTEIGAFAGALGSQDQALRRPDWGLFSLDTVASPICHLGGRWF